MRRGIAPRDTETTPAEYLSRPCRLREGCLSIIKVFFNEADDLILAIEYIAGAVSSKRPARTLGVAHSPAWEKEGPSFAVTRWE